MDRRRFSFCFTSAPAAPSWRCTSAAITDSAP